MARQIVAILLLACCAGSVSAAGEIGTQAPDFEFIRTWNMAGGQSRLSDFRGSVIVLEAFATW